MFIGLSLTTVRTMLLAYLLYTFLLHTFLHDFPPVKLTIIKSVKRLRTARNENPFLCRRK